MAFIPKDAEWYLADLVLELRIEGERRNVVHVNTHLIKARSPEQAYQKAKALGRACRRTYVNTDGKRVQVKFRGLRELNVIHEPLVDGAELMFLESVGMPERDLRRWITSKRKLGVFAPLADNSDAPNYFPKAALDLLDQKVKAPSRA